MGSAYRFVSRWPMPAPPSRCWAQLERMLRPDGDSWWPGVRVAEPPTRIAAGERLTLVVRSPLGYALRMRLRVTAVEPPRLIVAESTGDLRGEGVVTLSAVPTGSLIEIRWAVTTERGWMTASGLVLRPAFVAAHRRVMARGERALRAVVVR